MADLISEVVKSVEAEAQAKNINISLGSVPPTLSFNTDAKILKRILLEILDNAIQYTNQGGVVKMAVAPQGDKLLIEVQDNGIGISAEAQALEFTKFFRGGNFDKAKIPGAGLGLYISREYVKLLDGKIWFKSEEGKGSKFSVLL